MIFGPDHASNSIVLFTWYHPKMALLENNFRKQWETMKDFPFVNIAFKKIREKGKYLIRNSTWGEMWRSIMKFINDGR